MCYHCSGKGHISKDGRKRKYNNKKQYEKAEKAIDEDKDDLVVCSLSMENEKENAKKKVWFAEDVKQHSEAGMMCTIDGDTFFHSQKTHGLETLVHQFTSQMMN